MTFKTLLLINAMLLVLGFALYQYNKRAIKKLDEEKKDQVDG